MINMNLDKIVSPSFVIDEKILDDNLNIIKNSCNCINNKIILAYSLKTNPTAFLIKYLNRNGMYIEVVSDEEYEYALKIGINAKQIIYNGPIKSKNTLIMAIKSGSIVNIDSYTEFDWLLESNIFNKRIGIRINLPIDNELVNDFGESLECSRFGFSMYENKKLKQYIKKLKNKKNIEVNGLHFHCNTKSRTELVYKKIIDYSIDVIDKMEIKIDYLDIGGGFLGGKNNKFTNYSKIISESLNKHKILKNTNIIMEPGASIIATAVSYYCRVTDIKKIKNKRIITIDGSRVHIDPTFSNKKYSYVVDCKKDIDEKNIICGFTCMEKDRINLEDNFYLKVGDYIIFKNLGAYTMSFIPNFISSYPNVYWIGKSNKIDLVYKKKELWRCLK